MKVYLSKKVVCNNELFVMEKSDLLECILKMEEETNTACLQKASAPTEINMLILKLDPPRTRDPSINHNNCGILIRKYHQDCFVFVSATII